MRYIQNHFKTKIELGKHLYTGCIYQSRDYLGKGYHQTGVYLVNTYSYYQWRSIALLKSQRMLVDDFSKEQL
jgi:hypothetical protein